MIMLKISGQWKDNVTIPLLFQAPKHCMGLLGSRYLLISSNRLEGILLMDSLGLLDKGSVNVQ